MNRLSRYWGCLFYGGNREITGLSLGSIKPRGMASAHAGRAFLAGVIRRARPIRSILHGSPRTSDGAGIPLGQPWRQGHASAVKPEQQQGDLWRQITHSLPAPVLHDALLLHRAAIGLQGGSIHGGGEAEGPRLPQIGC